MKVGDLVKWTPNEDQGSHPVYGIVTIPMALAKSPFRTVTKSPTSKSQPSFITPPVRNERR